MVRSTASATSLSGSGLRHVKLPNTGADDRCLIRFYTGRVSDDYLSLISVDPLFMPDGLAGERAREQFEQLVPDAEDVKIILHDAVTFIDAGSNFEGVWCPRCNGQLEDAWWQDSMDAAAERSLIDLTVTTPCCASTLSLNDLDYRWPAGFARFVIEATNPGVSNFGVDETEPISQSLGTPLRAIWAHY
jgi:hypothetical protein